METTGSPVLRGLFASRFAQLDKKRKAAMSRPLTIKEVGVLLSMCKDKEPMYPSIESFYSQDYKGSLEKSDDRKEAQVQKYRPATEEEANLLYCDIHSRDVLENK